MLTKEEEKAFDPKDIIVTKHQTQIIYNKDGSYTTKRIPKLVNVTKKVNESKKLIKRDAAMEKLKELEEIYTKGVK